MASQKVLDAISKLDEGQFDEVVSRRPFKMGYCPLQEQVTYKRKIDTDVKSDKQIAI